MVIELVAVGTELLMGNTLNTNTHYLAEQCAGLGFIVNYQSVVGDNAGRIKDTLTLALSRSDIVILTGGLGPTEDDITRDVCAEVFDMPLQLEEDLKEKLDAYFKGSIYKCPASSNYRQAMVPRGAVVFENGNGTAPGLCLEKNGKKAILLPGPPNELIPMFEEQIVPFLRKLNPESLYSVIVKICGIGESKIEEQMLHLIDGQTNPTIATYAKVGETHVRVTAKAQNEEEARKRIEPVVEEIRRIFGAAVYTLQEKETLEMNAVKRLKEHNLTVATAESCTGGMLASRLVGVPGCSEVFQDGFVTYSEKAKQKRLRVKEETLNQYGAVSEQTAMEMAIGGRVESGADLCVSITGLAGPDAEEGKPVGLVYIGCSCEGQTEVEEFHFRGNREKIREQAVIKALDLIRRTVIERYEKKS